MNNGLGNWIQLLPRSLRRSYHIFIHGRENEYVDLHLGRLNISLFRKGTQHGPETKCTWGQCKLVRANMLVNGPTCKVKRWWLYTPGPSILIDWI